MHIVILVNECFADILKIKYAIQNNDDFISEKKHDNVLIYTKFLLSYNCQRGRNLTV